MIDLRTYNEHMQALTTALSELSSRVRQLEAVQIPLGGVLGPHDILSVTHTDSTPQVVSQGSLIVGDKTPTWNELVLGGITGSVVTRDATDVLWSTYALAGTAAQTYTFPPTSANIPGGSGVANRVAVWSGANTLSGSANLTFTTFLYANGGATVDCAFAVANRLRVRDAATPADYGTIFHSGAGGNLHFDSYSGGTFFNYYGGTSLVLCGAPAVRTVSVTPTGVMINGDFLVEGYFVTLAANLIGGTAVTNAPLEVLRLNSRVNTAGTGYAADGGSKMTIWAESASDGFFYGMTEYKGIWVEATAVSRKAMAQITAYDLLERAGISIYADGTRALVGIGATFSTANLPDRVLHAEVADAVTAAITYVTRTSHTTSGAAAALYGVGHEDELEDAAGNMQTASDISTLWAAATSGSESPLLRITTYPAGTAGPGYSGHWTWTGVDGTARTLIPNGTGDVTGILEALFAVVESAGGTAAGNISAVPGGAVATLYTDGVDTLDLAVAANGSVTVQRTAGAATFSVSLWMTWI